MKPINFYDLSDEKRKKIVKEACKGMFEKQKESLKKYERNNPTKR